MTMGGNYPHLRQAQRAIWADSRLSSQEKHVGVYMINRMRDDFTGAFPYIATICSDLSLHRATVIRSLSQLVEIGWFERRSLGKKRTYSVNDIEFLISMSAKHRDTESVAQNDLSRSSSRAGRLVNGVRQVAQNDLTSRTKRLVAGVQVAQDDTDRPKSLSAHRSAQEEGAPSAPPIAPFPGANPSEEKVAQKDALTTKSGAPPIPPREQVSYATIRPTNVANASGAGLPANFGSDPNNLNPYAQSVRQNRRYGGLAGLDGSEGVTFDITSGTLDVVNGTRLALEEEAKTRGLDLSAALVKAAVKLAKDPRNASPAAALAEIRQALQYQAQDRQSRSTGQIRFNRNSWGRGGVKGI